MAITELNARAVNAETKTSAKALKAFFAKGINEDRKVEGFEQAIYIDKNIPTETVNRIVKEVQLIDLNEQYPTLSIQEKIVKANELIKTLEKKDPFLEEPLTFVYEEVDKSLPYDGGPIIVRGTSIPNTWIDIMHNIYRYGKENLMDANTDRWVKEINNLVAVIQDPQNEDLSINPFLVPLTIEKIRAYQAEIKSPELPKDKAYTYGNKLRGFEVHSAEYLKELLTTDEYKDFEHKKGPHLEKNVIFDGKKAKIDQIQDMIDVLKRNVYIKSAVAMTWHVEDELMRKHKSSPCLVLLQALVHDEKLNLFAYFRSHDMVQGWPENAYGMSCIQKEIADALKIECGTLTITSGSAQIYKHYYKQVEEMLKTYRKKQIMYNDPKGNFIIQLTDDKMIKVTLLNPKTNRELEKYTGKTAKEVYGQLAAKIYTMDLDHAFYLGSELYKAELALQKGISFTQDKNLTW